MKIPTQISLDLRSASYAITFICGLALTAPSYASDFGNALLQGLGKAAETMSREVERQAEIERRLEAEKQLMEYRYELERKAHEAEAAREAERLEQERKARLIAEEKQKREAEEERKRAMNTGTGFFVTPNGYIVTNHHVIEDKTHYAVRDLQGNFYRAEVVASDANRDLALLRIRGTFRSLRIARSESVSKGQRVMALGYPQISIQGSESKVTDGVISSFSGINNDPNWFQISAPIQGGNSGGPLVTESGHVVGVVVATANAMKFFKNTGNIPQNVNYAIKSNVLLSFLAEQNIANVGSASGKSAIESVDHATVLVVAKGGPIDVIFSVSPEERATQERERAKLAAEEAAHQKAALAEEKKQKELAEQLLRRDQAVRKAFPDWDAVKSSAIFKAWLSEQPANVQKQLDSPKTSDIVTLLKRYRQELPTFAVRFADPIISASGGSIQPKPPQKRSDPNSPYSPRQIGESCNEPYQYCVGLAKCRSLAPLASSAHCKP